MHMIECWTAGRMPQLLHEQVKPSSRHICSPTLPPAQGVRWQLMALTLIICSSATATKQHRDIWSLQNTRSTIASLPLRARKLHQVVDVCKQAYPRVPFNWQSRSKVLSLTFDDGPHAKGMSAVLDVLKRHGVPATFFVNTYRQSAWLGPFTAPDNQAALKRALSEGHEIGSHAAEHLYLTNLTAGEIDNQIQWAIGNITAVTGGSLTPLFRAPYGDGFWSTETAPNAITQHLWDVVRKHHIHVSWSFSGNDYKLAGSVPGCADALFNAYGPPLVKQGITGVVLMHSTPQATGGCPEGLDRLLQYWKSAGYTFVTVPQVVQEIYGMQPAEVVRRAQSCSTHTKHNRV